MWNGAKELRMTWLWGAVLTFVPVKVEGHELSDVWRSQTVWKDSVGERHLYLTEGAWPHVGGDFEGADFGGYWLYDYEQSELNYYAYWSRAKSGWVWHDSYTSTGECNIVVRRA
jgi:hypothetical protein